jgi:hypothetical protein
MIRRTGACRAAARIGAAWILILGMAAALPAAAQNLITNPDFVSTDGNTSAQINGGTVTGWSLSGNNTDYATAYVPGLTGATYTLWDPAQGSANGFTDASPTGGNFAGIAKFSILSQTISGLSPGAGYVLSFAWAVAQLYGTTGAVSAQLYVTLGGSGPWTDLTGIASEGFSGWMNETMTFIATASSETLSFYASGNANMPMVLIADPQLIPEPAPVAVMGCGLIALFGLNRRRRVPSARRVIFKLKNMARY